jgi:predicted phosphodiesterase
MTRRKSTGNILCIGDTHIPNERKGYLDFCVDTYKKYNCSKVVHIGDVCDLHAISYHEKELAAPTSTDELKIARKSLKAWQKAFPNMLVTSGNHDNLITRKAKTHGLSLDFFKTMNDILELPATWVWNRQHIINNVLYFHGIGFSGKYPYANAMYIHRRNIVIGHCHSVLGTHFGASEKDILWGMSVGSGVDDESVVFDYGREMPRKSVISCGVVVENGRIPITVPMNIPNKGQV